MKVVAFNSSPRKEGNTDYLIRMVFKELGKEDIKTELINIGDQNIYACKACGECRKAKNLECVIKDDKLNDYIKKMVAADGIILGSPVYFSDVNSTMKALIDRAGYVIRANDHALARKVGAAVVAVRRAGSTHTFSTLNRFFLIGQMIVPGSSYWNIGKGGTAGEVRCDNEGIQTMETLGRNMAWLLKKIHAS